MHTLLIALAVLLAFIGGGIFVRTTFDNNPPEEGVTSSDVTPEEGVAIPPIGESEGSNTPSPAKPRGRTLDQSDQGLTKVPESIFKRTDIEVLDLSGNKFTGALPGEIRFLQNLRSLDLSDNSFTGVPAEIGQLVKLEYLDLSNNPITGLPNELGKLTSLKVLDLRGTHYSKQDLSGIRNGLSASIEIFVDSE